MEDYKKYLPVAFLVIVILAVLALSKRNSSTEVTNTTYASVTPTADSSAYVAQQAARETGINAAAGAFNNLVGLSGGEIAARYNLEGQKVNAAAAVQTAQVQGQAQNYAALLGYQSTQAQTAAAVQIQQDKSKFHIRDLLNFFSSNLSSVAGIFGV